MTISVGDGTNLGTWFSENCSVRVAFWTVYPSELEIEVGLQTSSMRYDILVLTEPCTLDLGQTSGRYFYFLTLIG